MVPCPRRLYYWSPRCAPQLVRLLQTSVGCCTRDVAVSISSQATTRRHRHSFLDVPCSVLTQVTGVNAPCHIGLQADIYQRSNVEHWGGVYDNVYLRRSMSMLHELQTYWTCRFIIRALPTSFKRNHSFTSRPAAGVLLSLSAFEAEGNSNCSSIKKF